MTKSIRDLSDFELHEFLNETLKYCSGIVASNLFNGDDGTEYCLHSIDIMAKVAGTFGFFDYESTRDLLDKWFTASLDDDEHPQMNWSYLAIPPVWDEYIVNKDDE